MKIKNTQVIGGKVPYDYIFDDEGKVKEELIPGGIVDVANTPITAGGSTKTVQGWVNIIKAITLEEYTMSNFTLLSTSQQAPLGMTWGDWIISEYNTDGYVIDPNAENNEVSIGLPGGLFSPISENDTSSSVVLRTSQIHDGSSYVSHDD